MRYRDYTLTLSAPGEAGYPLVAEADGDATAGFLLAPPGAGLQALAARLPGAERHAQTLRDAGAALFGWLFPPEVDAHLRTAWERAERAGDGLRLRLAITAADLAAWPWELLHDPVRNHTFATSTATPLVRYLPPAGAAPPAPRADPPLDLLLVLPAAPDLDLARERRNLSEVAEALGQALQVRVLDGAVTRADLADALLMGEYEIVHFGGHGAWTRGTGYVALNRPDGEEDWLDEHQLARLLCGFRSLRLVVLNACNTGNGEDGRGFMGIAPRLVASGIPAVVAMQHAVTDAAAGTFAREFYKRLLSGEDAGRVDVALAHARTMLAVLHSDGSWAAPALHSSAPGDALVSGQVAGGREGLDPLVRRERLAALLKSLQASAGHEEDWVLAPPGKLYEWRDQLSEAATAYRRRLDTASAGAGDAAAAGLAHVEARLAAVERALAQIEDARAA